MPLSTQTHKLGSEWGNVVKRSLMTLNMRNELPEEQSKSIMAFHPVTLEDRVHFNCKKKRKKRIRPHFESHRAGKKV